MCLLTICLLTNFGESGQESKRAIKSSRLHEQFANYRLLPPDSNFHQSWSRGRFRHRNSAIYMKGPVINILEGCPNVSPPVSEQCLLAFSASPQYYLRFNSESPAILVCSTF